MLFPPFYLLVYRHETNFSKAGSLKSSVESRNRTQDLLIMSQLCQPLEYNHDYVLWNTFRRLNISVKAKQILVTFCPSVLHRDKYFSFKIFVRKDTNEPSLNRKSLKFQRKVKSTAIVLHIWSAKLCSISIQILEPSILLNLKIQKLVATWLLKAFKYYADGCLKMLTGSPLVLFWVNLL